MSPAECDAASVWQLMAAIDGYVEANTPKDEKRKRPMTDAAKARLIANMETMPKVLT